MPIFGTPRRECAPAWRLTFFAGAKKVSKETPNTSLFERIWLNHLVRLQRVVRLGATSIHGDVKGLFFPHRLPTTLFIPAFAAMKKRIRRLPCEVMFRRDQPKTWPECQWLLAESRPHVCAPEPSYLSPHRLVLRCFFGDFLCTSKESYSAAGPRPGAVHRMPTPYRKTQAQIQKLSPTESCPVSCPRNTSP